MPYDDVPSAALPSARREVRSSAYTLEAPASEIGLGHAAEVATFGDDGAPISVLYFQRKSV